MHIHMNRVYPEPQGIRLNGSSQKIHYSRSKREIHAMESPRPAYNDTKP